MLQGKLPSELLAKRQQYLNSLKKFIDEQETKLKEALDKLGWTEDELLNIPKKQMCPYDKNHVVPETSFKTHVEKCKLLTAGYQKDELEPLLQSSGFWYSHADSIMKVEIDESLLNKIIWDHCVQTGQVYTGHRSLPVSHIDGNINLTQEDRLALYRHVVHTSQEAGKVMPVDRSDELLTTDWSSLIKKGLLNEQSNKEFSSKLEQLAALRDMKRRRLSYRAKNVHITKKSYTEIIREVIVNQMEVLKPPEEDAKPNLSTLNDSSERERDRYDRGERSNRSRYDSRDRDRRPDASPVRERRRRSPRTDRRRDPSPSYGRFQGRASSGDRYGGRSRLREHRCDSRQNYDAEPAAGDSPSVGGMGDSQVKQELLSDDSQGHKSKSHASGGDDGEEDRRKHRRRKRSPSLCEHSDGDPDIDLSNQDDRHSKRKKSKHKKQHSKKHKRKSS